MPCPLSRPEAMVLMKRNLEDWQKIGKDRLKDSHWTLPQDISPLYLVQQWILRCWPTPRKPWSWPTSVCLHFGLV